MSIPSEEEFYEFIADMVHVDVVSLAAEFPDQRHIEVSWTAIENHDAEWTEKLRSDPYAFIDAFEQALTTYPALPPHGQVSFYGKTTTRADPPFVRLTDVPSEISITGAQHHVGELVRIAGYTKSLNEPEAQVAEAVYECSYCEHTHHMTVVGTEHSLLSVCRKCGTADGYQFDSMRSRMVNTQTGRLHPLDVTKDTTVDFVLQHDLIETVSPYEPVMLTGILCADGADHKSADTTLLVNNIETTDREIHRPRLELIEDYLDTSVADPTDLSTNLDEWMHRSTIILRTQSLTEEEAQAKIITPLLHVLGWNIYSKNVQIEYSESGSGSTVDYMLTADSGHPLIPVEAKAPKKHLDTATDQLGRYLRVFDCEIALLTNGEEYHLYDRLSSSDEIQELWSLNVHEIPDNTAALVGLRYDVAIDEGSLRTIYTGDSADFTA